MGETLLVPVFYRLEVGFIEGFCQVNRQSQAIGLAKRLTSEAYIVEKLREEKDEVPTIYSRACGFVETVDDFIGLGCLDKRKKDPQLTLPSRL